MSNETLFYVFGIALAVSAVLVSIAGLRMKDFPGKAFPMVVLWFVVLVGGATTFAVLHAKDEKSEKSAELAQAGKEIEKETSSGPFESGSSGTEGAEGVEAESEEAQGEGFEEVEPEKSGESEAAAKGPGGTLQLAANPTELKFDKTGLTSKSGKVTIEFENPSAIPHNLTIEKEGEEIAGTKTFPEGEESVSAELAPGTYTFLCTVPGHAEAGMEGTLVVK
jgi:plastocyanin